MYYIIGSLKISLSNGRCCIKRHLLIRISLRLRTVGKCRIIGQDSVVLMFFLEESPFTSLKLHFWVATMFMPSACGIFVKLFFSLNFIALNDILIDLYFICTDSSMIEIGKDFQSNAHAFHYITSYLYSLFRYFDTRKSFWFNFISRSRIYRSGTIALYYLYFSSRSPISNCRFLSYFSFCFIS